jgi:hypothetical protein
VSALVVINFFKGSSGMSAWESVSGRGTRTKPVLVHRPDHSCDAATADVDVPNKWHPRKTLVFIFLSCGLLWGGIFALARVL